MKHIDFIGDIHGNGTALIHLLKQLGYEHNGQAFSHPERRVIFLGDFIDGNAELKQHRLVLDTVMNMIDHGSAQAVMGNHEYNALLFHTFVDGKPLRPHSDKNIQQHQAFLNEYQYDEFAKQNVLNFFRNLPLWIDTPEYRVVHACWDKVHINYLREFSKDGYLSDELLKASAIEGTKAFNAIEQILKGPEMDLPEGISYTDKHGTNRTRSRLAWWNQGCRDLNKLSLLPDDAVLPEIEVDISGVFSAYLKSEPACFIGHYWRTGKPSLLSSNIACVDYSAGRGGKLVAYCWKGEFELSKDHFFC